MSDRRAGRDVLGPHGLTLLVVDDDDAVRRVTVRLLEAAGHRVEEAAGGEAGRELLETRPRAWFDLVLLDLCMPDVTGWELLGELRARNDDTAVILVTASDEEGVRVRGLRQGADDVVAKPFDPDELLARVDAVTRRRLALPTVRRGDLVVDLARGRVRIDGVQAELSPQEFAVLRALLEAQGGFLGTAELLAAAWDDSTEASATLVPVTVRRLRQRLGPRGGRLIENVRGRGYRLADPGEEAAAEDG